MCIIKKIFKIWVKVFEIASKINMISVTLNSVYIHSPCTVRLILCQREEHGRGNRWRQCADCADTILRRKWSRDLVLNISSSFDILHISISNYKIENKKQNNNDEI